LRCVPIKRKSVKLIIRLPDPQEGIPGTDVNHTVNHGDAAADGSAGVELPEDLSIAPIIGAHESSLRTRPDQAVVALAGNCDRSEIRLVVRAWRFPENLPGGAVKRADGTLSRMIGNRRVNAFTIACKSKFNSAELSARSDFFGFRLNDF